MAAGNTNYTTRAIAITLQKHGKEVFDAVSTNNALLNLLKERGNIKIVEGGRKFTHPLIYGLNTNFGAISKYEAIPTNDDDIITRAEYTPKIIAGSIPLSYYDMAINAGSETKLLDYAKEKKLESQITMEEVMGDQVFTDGSDVKSVAGLRFLINDAPSSQSDVGGINPSTSGNDYWRNYTYTTAVTGFNTNHAGLIAMNTCVDGATFGRQGPRAVITTKAIYQLYKLSMIGQIQYVSLKKGDKDFQALEFATMPVMFDDNAPASHMYFIDTANLWLQVLKQGNFMTTEARASKDQLADIILMYFFGELTTGSRRTQAVATNITA